MDLKTPKIDPDMLKLGDVIAKRKYKEDRIAKLKAWAPTLIGYLLSIIGIVIGVVSCTPKPTNQVDSLQNSASTQAAHLQPVDDGALISPEEDAP